MSAEEAASLYNDFSLLWSMYLGETVTEKVDNTMVAVEIFEDVPF